MRIEDINLKPVENGFKLSYTEVYKKNTKDNFSNSQYDYKELVYKDDESEEAFKEMMRLHKMSNFNCQIEDGRGIEKMSE